MAETRRQRRRVKLAGAFLSVIFAFTQVLFAHLPTQTVWESRRARASMAGKDVQLARLMDTPPLGAASAVLPTRDSAAIRLPASRRPADNFLRLLPPELVSVRDVIAPASTRGPLSGRRIIVVQDVHLNPEAQKNIAGLLFRLMGDGQAGLVAVEGAVGAFDLARFRRYADRSVTDAVARAFLVAGRIGAPSFAGITTSAEPPVFWGVDDAEHYDRNVDAYRAGLKGRSASESALASDRERLGRAKAAAFTPELAALDRAASEYESGKRGLGEHLELLSAAGVIDALPADRARPVLRFLEAWRIERRLDFDRADRERRAALEKLVARLAPGEVDGLVALSLAYRDGRLAFGDYHRSISSLLERKGVSLERLPAFSDFLRYALLSDGIDADALLAATREATQTAFDRLARTPEQKKLIAEGRRVALKRKLLDFALTPSEWEEYAAGGFEANLSPFENFYREAHVRSERMADNLAAALRRTDGSKVGVLVIGGFHAPEIGRLLGRMGASCAVVSPKLTKVDAGSGTAYLSVFSREKTPLEKLFEGDTLFVYPAHINVGAAGPRTDAVNDEFEASQILTGQLRGRSAGVASAKVGVREFHAVPAGSRVPFGYSAVAGAVQEVDGAPIQFVRRAPLLRLSEAAAALRRAVVRVDVSAVPLQMGGLWNRLGAALGLAPQSRARLSFVEEFLFFGVLVYALPWVLTAVAGYLGAPAESMAWLRPAAFAVAQVLFAADHRIRHSWTSDGRIESRPAGAGTIAAAFLAGTAFRSLYIFGFGPAAAMGAALAAHALWNNVLARIFTALPLLMTSAATAWWKIPGKTYVAMSVPIFALRRNPANDPGIGKFTDLGRTYREILRPQGVDVVLLLPHYATLDESPYAPVSLFALQERYIDWSAVPEVAGDKLLLESLIAPVSEQGEVDYAAVGRRENRVAAEAFTRFKASLNSNAERASAFALFVRQNQGWLREYADFMAVHDILNKSSMEWSDADVEFARGNKERYERIYEMHCYRQWIAYRQFSTALGEIEKAGGKLLFDVPMYRGKDSVAVRNHGKYFRDVATRSPGIKNAWTDQTWGDLALWNWPELAKDSFDYILGPVRHWLRFGLHGARSDALHFAYPIGQFGNGDEPGEAFVARLASTYNQYQALPLAEAFENKADDVAAHGIVTIDGNWQRFSTHDDGARNHVGDPVNFIKDFLGRFFGTGDTRASRFVAFTLGDLDGDQRTVKTMEDGRSHWRYRMPLAPVRHLGRLTRFLSQTLPDLRHAGRSVWEAAADVRVMFESATESFIKHRNGAPEIWAASRDWFFEQWGRDTFIALPGVLLATHRYEIARDLLRSFVKYERNGLIPNRIWDPSRPETIEYNTSDASMWFIQSVKKYYEYTNDLAFLQEMMPVMQRIMAGYMNGTGWDGGKHINPDPALNDRRIVMDPADGLISVPAQSTWMDADPHGRGAVTPRSGKPVEINALWYANLRFMERVVGAGAERERYGRIAEQVKENFNDKFWNESENALFDVAPGGPHHGAIRPNMIFAVSHGGDLLSPERQEQVVESVRKDLLTPYGLRTLSPRDSNYRARYETWRQPGPDDVDFPNHKDFAYHQGTAWPWLMGAYADALATVRRNQNRTGDEIQEELREIFEPIVNEFVSQGSLHEVYDGSPRVEDGRQHPGGTSSQAWSVAEVYRTLVEHGVLADTTADEEDWVYENAEAAADKTIVEVTMEMAMSAEGFAAMSRAGIDHQTQVLAAMATSTGGIGPLLKERVIALGDLGAQVIGFSLLYEHVWVQRVVKGVNGAPDTISQEKVRIGDAFRKVLEPAGEVDVKMFDGTTVTAKVWKSPAGMFGKSTVYYLDNPAIADVVYPGATDAGKMTTVTAGDHLERLPHDEQQRLKSQSEVERLRQNWLVGRGSLAWLKKIDRRPDITVMSEMPSTLSFHRLVEDEYTRDPFFERTLYVFNDHTPLEYAHPKWDAYGRTRMKLQPKFYENQDVMTPKGEVDGTAMIINAADVVYGVAKKHGDVMRAMPQLQQFGQKIETVTNGVSHSYWPADEFRDTERALALSDEQIGRVKSRRREELMKWLEVRAHMPAGWADRMLAAGASIGIWTRRVVGYKRMDVFASLLEDDAMREDFINSNIIFVVGGRIHQDDPFGLRQYRRIQAMMQKDPRLKDRIIFFENYNILEAPMLFRGADFSVMLADDGYEAAATGFQKAQMNGVLIIASHDGAVPESVIFQQRDAANANGFEVPYVAVQPGKPAQPTPQGLSHAFHLFAEARRQPDAYARMVRKALAAAPRVDVVRTAKDMLLLFDKAFRRQAAELQAFADGRQIAQVHLANSPLDSEEARSALNALATAPAFDWRFKEKGHHEKSLYKAGSGVAEFLRAYRHVRSMGSAGEWAFQFHLANNQGRGDIIAFLDEAFSKSPELAKVALAIREMGERARLAGTMDDKARMTRAAIGIAEETLDRLNVVARAEQAAVSPGLLGLWAGWGFSLERKTVAESAWIGLMSLAGVMLFGSLLSLALGTPASLTDGAVLALLASALASIFGFSVIHAAHRAYGVLQPDDSVSFDPAVVFRASLVASTSLSSIPFFAFGLSALLTVSLSPWIAGALFIGGAAAALVPHLIINRRIFSAAARRPETRSPGVRRLAGPLLNTGVSADGRSRDAKDPSVVFADGRWHLYGTPDRDQALPYHAISQTPEGPFRPVGPVELLDAGGAPHQGRFEAPGVVYDPRDGRFHMFAQTTFNSLGGRLVHFVSVDGQVFRFADVAVESDAAVGEAGVYDAHPVILPDGSVGLAYAAMEHAAPDRAWADPDIAFATADDWSGPWTRRGRILTHDQVPFHNRRGTAGYEWGLEGPQVIPIPSGNGHRYLLVGTAFLGDRERGQRQRVFAAVADRPEGPYADPVVLLDPALDSAWASGENGHASGAIRRGAGRPSLLLYYQARSGAERPWNVGLAEVSLDSVVDTRISPPVSRESAAGRTPAPSTNEEQAVPLGLLGVWSSFPSVSMSAAAVVESLAIAFVGVMALWLMLGNPFLMAALDSSSFWSLTEAAARVSLIIGAVLFPPVLFAHLVFGVMQPDPRRVPVWSWPISMRASLVAMSSALGMPLVVLAGVLWRAGVDLTLVGAFPLVALGIVLGVMKHKSFNTRLLDWYAMHRGHAPRDIRLTPTVRQRLIEHTGTVLSYLAERTVTRVGPEVQALRERRISGLPDDIVTPIAGSWEDRPVDTMIVFGSHYLEVPSRAARMFWTLRDRNPNLVIIFAGGMGPRTKVHFPYWSSEAELFRDSFVSALRATRRLAAERKLASAFGTGRYSDTLIELVLLIDDLLFGYLHALPRAIHLDTDSTNTGANIENVTRILERERVSPRNVMIMTAGVFQLRLRASMLQQFKLPIENLYSFSATAPRLDSLSDHDLAELADEARDQVRRLDEYPNVSPEPFTIPVSVPDDVRASYEQLHQALENASLLGFASTPPSERTAKKAPSFVSTFAGVVLVLVALSFVTPSEPMAWASLTGIAFRTAIHVTAAFVAGATVYVGLFSRSVGQFPVNGAPAPIRPFVSILRYAVPLTAVGLYLWSSIGLGALPAWASAASTLVLGAFVRSWALAHDRRRAAESDDQAQTPAAPTPGAVGLWSRTGSSLAFAGGVEGALTALIALATMGTIAGLSLLVPGASQAPLVGAWSALSIAGIAAGRAAIGFAHRRWGVTPAPGLDPDFDRLTVERAVNSASISLFAVPLLAIAILAPGVWGVAAVGTGLLAAVVPHALLNRQAALARAALTREEQDEAAELARKLRRLTEARRNGTDDDLAAALADLTGLESLHLDAFGREAETARRTDTGVAYQLSVNEGAYAEWQFALTSAGAGRGTFEAGTVGGFVESTRGETGAGDAQRRRDHVAVVTASPSREKLIEETRSAVRIADGRPLVMILADGAEPMLPLVRGEFSGLNVRFVGQSGLDSAEAIEALLLQPALHDAGRLKLLVSRESGLPDFLIEPLVRLGRQDRYRDLVELVIVTALSGGAFAVRASIADIERAVSFRELVLSQA